MLTAFSINFLSRVYDIFHRDCSVVVHNSVSMSSQPFECVSRRHFRKGNPIKFLCFNFKPVFKLCHSLKQQ